MNSKKIPPTIWNELIETPINSKKTFPKNKKNVSTDDDIIKTKIESFKVFLESIVDVNTTNKGISDRGSIATKVFNRFWKKISCILVHIK